MADLDTVTGVEGLAEKYGASPSTGASATRLAIVTDQEAADCRNRQTMEAMKEIANMKVINGLLYPLPRC